MYSTKAFSLLTAISLSCYYAAPFAISSNSLFCKVWARVRAVCNAMGRAALATGPAQCQQESCHLLHLLHNFPGLIGLNIQTA